MHISLRPEPLVDQLDRIIDTESIDPMESILLSPVEFAVIQRRIELGEIEGRIIRDGVIGYRQTLVHRSIYPDLPKHPVDQLVAYNMGLMDFVVDYVPVEEEDTEIELEDDSEEEYEEEEYDDDEFEDVADDNDPIVDESQQLVPGGARKAIFGW